MPLHHDVPHRPPHLLWVLDNLVEGRVVNEITVDEHTKYWAKVALNRMLDITAGVPVREPEGVPPPADAPPKTTLRVLSAT